MRRCGIYLVKVPEGEDTERHNGREKIFQEKLAINFPELTRDTNIQIIEG